MAASSDWPQLNGNDGNNWGIPDPTKVDLTGAAYGHADDGLTPNMLRDITCFLNAGDPGSQANRGVRISAIFVILIVSSAVTFFPVLATRSTKVKIPLYVYLFARYFGAGVIVATAFVHLLDPSYDEIGAASCVGQTGGWAGYSWPPVIAMASCLFVFLGDFAAERYVEKKYGLSHGTSEQEGTDAMRHGSVDAAMLRYSLSQGQSGRRNTTTHESHQHLHSGEQDGTGNRSSAAALRSKEADVDSDGEKQSIDDEATERSFRQQISAFLTLEFGVIFHSVIIGLTLAVAGAEFNTLYPVIVFHQSFEGMGIGARLSAIPFPKRLSWMPWALCTAYGLTTPISIAIGLGISNTYNSGSYVANVVSGVLDATSAGILLYTGLVELLARDFLFNPDRTRDDKMLTFMIICVLAGAGIMALLGKWA